MPRRLPFGYVTGNFCIHLNATAFNGIHFKAQCNNAISFLYYPYLPYTYLWIQNVYRMYPCVNLRFQCMDHHVSDLSNLQTAALGFVEGHPAGVVGTHLQSLLYGHRFSAVVAGLVNPDNGIRIGAWAVGTESLDDTVVGISPEGIELCGAVTQNGLQIFVWLIGPVDERTLDRQRDAVFRTDSDALLGG